MNERALPSRAHAGIHDHPIPTQHRTAERGPAVSGRGERGRRAAAARPHNGDSSSSSSSSMFVIPALLSITLDATLAIVYFRQLLAQEEGRAWLHLLDVSASNFDLALAAVLRIVFLCPYIWSYMHRLRIVYSLLPWTWEAANMALVTARLVFLLSGLVRFDVEYFLVGASYASVLLQAVCLEHLRSSAPRERRIFLLGGAGAGGGLLDPALQPLTGGLSSSSASSSSGGGGGAHQRGGGGGRELYDGHQEDVDFIAGITAKMKRAKAYWQGKTEALRVLWNDLGARSRASYGSSGSSGVIVPASQQPFSLLLRLFTYEDVLGELDEAFARDPGQVEFYIPQLVTFLLYGAFWSSGSLQAFLLDKCARSVHFAHRLHWYLRAACLHGSSGINPDGLRQLTALMKDVKARGQRAAVRLEEGRMPQELPQQRPHDGQPHRAHRGRRRSQSHSQQGSSSAESSGGYWKEKEMQPCESFTSSTHTNRTSSLGVGTGGGDGDGGSAYLDVAALPPPAPPLTPPPMGSSAPLALATTVTGSSSVPSSPRAAAAASTRFPVEAGAHRGADGDLFGVLPAFIDAITALSRDLMPVPRERRNAVLRSGLQELGAKFLPSNVVYMPVGNAYHRVWRVHALESFAFSTKERVPCLVCFEVVDYARPPLPHYRQGGKHGKQHGHGSSSKWWSAMGMQENPLPAISRTFKFGNKEWTLKIGEPKEGGEGQQGGEEGEKEEEKEEEEEDRDDGGRPLHLGSPALASPPPPPPPPPQQQQQQQQHQGAATVDDSATIASPAALLSSGRRLTLSGGGPSTIDGSMSGGMGQWASTAAEEGGRGTAGLPHLVLDIAAPSSEEEAAPPSAESRDDYGTFSPPTATSPVAAGSSAGGGPRKQPLLLPTEEEGRAGGPFTATATEATPSTTTAEVAPSTPHGTYHPPAGPPLSPATAAAQAPVIFKERWKQKEERLRRRSPVGHLPRWRLLPVIVKANDDLRQEQFASQLLRQIDQILRDARIPVWMRPYDIVATAHDGGLIEAIPDTVSLDALRRNDPQYTTLPDFFERLFGQRGSQGLQRARQAFVESLAAYSIVCFLLQIKDRHNGNILVDAEGHLIHIDFGFLLARSPGNVNFERAPFKLTAEFVEVMEGPRSPSFKRFRELCVKTYLELRRQRHKIILLVEMVVSGNETLPCFGGRPQATVEALRQRFQPELNDRACSEFVNGLIDQSLDNWRTRWYDRYQSCFELR